MSRTLLSQFSYHDNEDHNCRLDASSLPPLVHDLVVLQALDKVLIMCEPFKWYDGSTYVIKNIYGEELFASVEPTASIFRKVLGASRPLKLELMANQRTEDVLARQLVLTLYHPFGFPYSHQLSIRDSNGDVVNEVYQEASLKEIKYTIREPNGDLCFTIKEGALNFGHPSASEQSIVTINFEVRHELRVMGHIKLFIYNPSKAHVHGPRFEVSFPSDMYTRFKAALIASAILINLSICGEMSDEKLYHQRNYVLATMQNHIV